MNPRLGTQEIALLTSTPLQLHRSGSSKAAPKVPEAKKQVNGEMSEAGRVEVSSMVHSTVSFALGLHLRTLVHGHPFRVPDITLWACLTTIM